MYAFDTETYLFSPGDMAPRIVCGSVAEENGEIKGQLLPNREAVISTFRRLLDSGSTISFANAAYDLAVAASADPTLFPAIFKALREGRIHDVLIAQALDAIYYGTLGTEPNGGPLRTSKGKISKRYSLDVVTRLVLGRSDAKEHDTWRKSYALLEGIEAERWPEEARIYAVDDAENTLEVALAQRQHKNLENLPAQVEAAFALHLGACWGLRTDPERVEKLAAEVEEKHRVAVERYQKKRWIREDGTKDQAAVKRAVALAYGATGTCTSCGGTGKIGDGKKSVTCKGGCDGTGLDLSTAPNLPRSDKGGVKTDRDALMESGADDLSDYGEATFEKIHNTYLPWLSKGTTQPLGLQPNVLLYTGRCSYEGPIQQMPRKGGVRECFVARPGRVFCSTDYAAGELCTLAQYTHWIVGESRMIEIINATKDPGSLHTMLGAQMLGISFEDMQARIKEKDQQAKDYRQAAKSAAFGYPGGLGPVTLVLTNRRQAAGETKLPDGTVIAGIRFCVLLGGAERCGEQKIREWKGRECAPVCRKCVELAEALRRTFFKTYPEVKKYLDWVSAYVEANENIPQFAWNPKKKEHEILRVRGGVGYCDAANQGFQGLLSDIGKRAFCRMTREGYLGVKDDGSPSPLAGARFPLFAHDEPFSELPEGTAHLAGPRIAEIMVDCGRELAPDVYWKAEPALMRAWNKGAEPVYVDGKLMVWKPKNNS